MFSGSPLGVVSRALPSLIGGFNSRATLNFSDKLLIDATEFINAIYEDMTQINDILTLKDATLMIEGVALFYKGYPLVNSLPS